MIEEGLFWMKGGLFWRSGGVGDLESVSGGVKDLDALCEGGEWASRMGGGILRWWSGRL